MKEKYRLVASHKRPDRELNPPSFGAQDNAPTEPVPKSKFSYYSFKDKAQINKIAVIYIQS